MSGFGLFETYYFTGGASIFRHRIFPYPLKILSDHTMNDQDRVAELEARFSEALIQMNRIGKDVSARQLADGTSVTDEYYALRQDFLDLHAEFTGLQAKFAGNDYLKYSKLEKIMNALQQIFDR